MQTRDRLRVHAWLDGALPAEEAAALQQRLGVEPALAEYAASMRAARAAMAELRADTAPLPAFRAPSTMPGRGRQWRAVVAIATAAAAAIALFFPRPSAPPAPADVPIPGVGSVGSPAVTVALRAPNARHVAVTGDFNDWSTASHPLRDDDGDGVWTGTLSLAPGRYAYMFVVDEEWVADPAARILRDDGFGGRNGILEI